MLEYYAILYRKLRKPVEQVLIYFGTGKPKCQNRVLHKNLNFLFAVIYLSEIPYEEFLDGESSEEVILSILADFQGKPAEDVIGEILTRLTWLQRNNKLQLQRLLTQLEVIAQLRNLQHQTSKLIDKMITGYDLTKDVRYQQGIEKGYVQGIEKGIEKGKMLAAEEKNREFVTSLIVNCPEFSDENIVTIASAPVELVKKLRDS